MGKKSKSKSSSSKALESEPSTTSLTANEPEEQGAQGGDAAAAPAAEVVPSSSEALEAAASTDLAAQLLAAQHEIENLKAQLAAKDAELVALKQAQLLQGEQNAAAAGQGQAVLLQSQVHAEEMSKLQERLKQLRKEQQEADAAKDAAWRQLKTVINDISKLAMPVTSSISLPHSSGSMGSATNTVSA